MAALFQAVSHFLTMTILFFALLPFEILDLIRSVTRAKRNSSPTANFTTQYLRLVEETIPAIHYNGKLIKQGSSECAVCLSELLEGESVRKLTCKHTFHKDCLDPWLQHYLATCPICRSDVLPDEIVAIYHFCCLQNQIENDGRHWETMFLLSSTQGRAWIT